MSDSPHRKRVNIFSWLSGLSDQVVGTYVSARKFTGSIYLDG